MSFADINCLRILSAAVAATPILAPGLVLAASGAHQHGVAELTVALEGRELEIMFSSPAMSVVGFEHRASSPRQIEMVTEAEARLRDVAGLFNFTGTDCELKHAEIDVSAVLEHGDGLDVLNNDHKHKSEEHHHHEDEAHTDISAHYLYSCDNSAELETIRVGPEGLPFSLEKINVMWISDRDQGATVLTATNRMIEFK